ncbi:MAG: terminase large subunit domain-containing protein [Planctomycetaceae bacterium]
MNSLNLRKRTKLIARIKLRQELDLRVARESPAAFRRMLRISDAHTVPWAAQIQPWQEQDFQNLDNAWRKLAGHAVTSRYDRAYLERPRGHSKTTDMAVQLAWILLFARTPRSGLAVAADREQSALIRHAIERIARLNPALCDSLVFHNHAVINPRNHSRLDIISSDVNSSWGRLPDFVICDELCHWDQRELWFSLFSSAAKQPHCLLAVLTNAGVGRDWQWDVRELARTCNNWYFSSLDGSHAPWISAAWLDEQRRLLPTPLFNRLWLNEWQHSDGEFVTLDEADACIDPALSIREEGTPGVRYVAAIDYAEKHDDTVGVVVHREGDRVVVDRLDMISPSPLRPVPIAWVEEWIEQTAVRFPSVEFVVDEYQLLGTIQKLSGVYPLVRFPFASGKGNHVLALALRRLIVNRELNWYLGCGQRPGIGERDDLATELASLKLVQSPSGRCRFDHRRDGVHHDDRSFAVGAACWHLLGQTEPTGPDWFSLTPPSAEGSFAW